MLVLCFTEALASWLRPTLDPGIDVSVMSDLVLRHLAEAGQPPATRPGDDEAWDLACLAAEEVARPRWDTIIVDEAQDFTEASWLLVARLGEGRRLWAFLDEKQRFWPNRGVPADLRWSRFTLMRPCRCPEGIQTLAEACLGAPLRREPIRRAREDGRLKLVLASPGEAVRRTSEEIDRLIGSGFEEFEIAVVSLGGRSREGTILQHRSLGRHRPVDATDPSSGRRLVADSFLRFKGLERSAIVVTDLHVGTPAARGVRMYIALTRATAVARVVATRDDLRHDPALAALAEEG